MYTNWIYSIATLGVWQLLDLNLILICLTADPNSGILKYRRS